MKSCKQKQKYILQKNTFNTSENELSSIVTIRNSVTRENNASHSSSTKILTETTANNNINENSDCEPDILENDFQAPSCSNPFKNNGLC